MSSPPNPPGPSSSQPSSILFFIAVAIGVLIALVFIFFSMRYYVRTKLGIYATARITTSSSNGVVLLSGDFPLQTYNAYNGEIPSQLRSRRRRRRYMKKRRLTEEEVDHLFPSRTYQNWLDGGAERDIDNRDLHDVLKEENDEDILQGENNNSQENINTTQSETQPEKENNTAQTTDDVTQHSSIESADVVGDSKGQVDLGNPYQEEIHFDSGSCAICIDTFEPEDLVRGLICGHVFHQECLDPWLIKRKACCPMCKRDYYLKNNNGNGDPNSGNTDGDNAENADVQSVNQYTELQYTTLSERVAEVLARNPSVEQLAKDKIEKYLRLKWRIFWFVMGISRADLLNSAIIAEDQILRERATAEANAERLNNTQNPTETAGADNTAQSRERVEQMV